MMMKPLGVALFVGFAFVAQSAAASAQSMLCELCVQYSGTPTMHTWHGHSGFCDTEEVRNVNNCQTNQEQAEGGELQDGPCPTDDCETEEDQQEQQELLAAFDMVDMETVSWFIENRDWAELNVERAALQILTCTGAVKAHLPVDLATLSVDR
jgi:hypothetical protein